MYQKRSWVVQLFICGTRGEPMVEVSHIRVKNNAVQYHKSDELWKGHLSLAALEDLRQQAHVESRECNAWEYNIVIVADGILAVRELIGKTFRVGGVTMQGVATHKDGIYAKISKEGLISVDDKVKVILPE